MASTYSALKIELIGTGEQVSVWGNTTNTNLGTAIEEAIVGEANADFPSDGDLTLTLVNNNASQIARHFVLDVTSSVALTTTRNLVVPSIEKPYIITNNTTGGESIVVKTAAGLGVTVPNGERAYVYVDGVDVTPAFSYTALLTVGGTLDVGGAGDIGGALDVGGALSVASDGTFSGTGQVKLPAGNTAQRSGSPVDGMLRYNSDLDSFEGYVDGQWGGIGGAQAGGAIMTNKSTASVSYTIAAGENGLSVGPVTVSSGVTITVADGQRWLIL
jgi:hypothetical protein